MMNKHLKIAYDTSDEILNMLNFVYPTGAVATDDLISAVSKKVNCHISVRTSSFQRIGENIKNFGAMMLTATENGERVAKIVLNGDKPLEFQRFSLAHELGHLAIDGDNQQLFKESNEDYVVSTHVNYDVTTIQDADYIDQNDNIKSQLLYHEQLANIFALRVLMPWSALRLSALNIDSLSEIAEQFDVPSEAVISRLMLSK